VVVFFFGLFGLFLVWFAIRSWRYRVKVRERDARVRTASAEAAEDDPYFAASDLEAHARGLFVACQSAWDARDVTQLSSLVGEDLLVEWKRRLDDFERKGWHNRVSVLGTPKIEYVGLVNREDDTEDRAVVRITASLRAFVEDRAGHRIKRSGAKSEQITLCEYWTLARSGDAAWKVVSIEQRAEGDHHLDADRGIALVRLAAGGRFFDRAGSGGWAAAGIHDGGSGGGGVRRDRARAGARPVVGRRSVRAGRPGGRGAAGGGGMGGGGGWG
jgi:hypothetical protein